MKTFLYLLAGFFFWYSAASGGTPRKGISYKPTADGGRACFIDGVFAYELPKVPTGLWGSTYGVPATPALQGGPLNEKDWGPYLRSLGMTFARGSSASYFAQFGHLVVVNTREQQAFLVKLIGQDEAP
jgi:hypothetical protein